MKRFIPIIAFLFISNILFAQYENFDLSKYKLPDIKRHQLDLKVNLSNSYSNKNDIDNETFVKSNFAEQFGMNYKFFQNTHKLQRSYYSSLSNNFEFNKSTDEDVLQNKERDLSSHLHVNLDNRFYLQEEKFFIHIEPSVTMYYRHDKEKSKVYNQNHDYINRINKDFDFAPTVNLGVGYGRVESVGDLRHAIYILEEFEKNGITSGVAADEDVLAIARRASELKNKRFFDSRIRKIYEIKSLDSLIQEMNLIDETNAVYYSILNDMWDYGNEIRQSGNRIQFDVNGGWNYSKDKSVEYFDEDTEDDNEEHSAKIGTKVNFDSYKPIGLKWERYVRIEGTFLHNSRPNVNNDYAWGLDYLGSSNTYEGRLSYGYKWYRNTRTSISFGASGYYSKRIRNSEIKFENENYGIDFSSRVNYYFSPRLRMFYNLNLGYNISSGLHGTGEWDDVRFNFSNSLTLNYAIF